MSKHTFFSLNNKSLLLSVLLGLAIMTISNAPVAARLQDDGADVFSSTAEEQKKFHYVLAMSADNSLCKPIAKLYNQMLKSPLSGGSTDYETREAEKFLDVGLTPAPITKHGYFKKFYSLNLFDEKEPRTLIIEDYPLPENDNGGSGIILLIKNAEYKENDTHAVDAEIIDREIATRANHPEYVLKKWPNFAKIESYAAKNPRNYYLPSIGDGEISVFLRSNSMKPYFIQNQVRYFPLSYDPDHHVVFGSIILVFQLLPTGREDICYLNLIPSTFNNKLDEESHD